MRVTITDIARKLNISASTVSRALKDDPRISEDVRKTVNAAAKEMGYRPNLLARSLVSDKTCVIGLVVNDISWAFFSELSQHIQNAAEKFGYSMFLYSSADSAQKEKLGIESMIARRSDGLIVYSNEQEDNLHLLESISKDGYPIVLLNNLEHLALDIVAVDNLQGTRQVMQHLFNLGHTRIAYIGPTPVKSVEIERLRGFELSMQERFGSVERSLVYTGRAYTLFGYDSTLEILKKAQKPTAIVAYNDNMALGVIRAIMEAGLEVPGDISVVGFDGLEIGLSVYPPLTTVSVPIQQMALAAVQMIVHRLGMKEQAGVKVEFSPQVIQLAPQLVMRESAGLAPQS